MKIDNYGWWEIGFFFSFFASTVVMLCSAKTHTYTLPMAKKACGSAQMLDHTKYITIYTYLRHLYLKARFLLTII